MAEETYSTTGPECPYCGHEHQPNEDPGHYYNDHADTSTCEICNKDFKMEVFTSHSWTCETFDE